MRKETIEYHSDGLMVRANWMTPDDVTGPLRVVVQGPGWFGLKDAAAYVPYHEALTAGGLAVLCIDYRGFGESEGESGLLSPSAQLADLRNAVAWLSTRSDVESNAIGAFGTGGTGGGNAVMLAAHEPRVAAVVSQFPVADGRMWLKGMRSEHEWLAFLEAVGEDRRQRALTGKGRMVARQDIMIPTPERAASGFKADVDQRVAESVPLAIVDELLAYRPGEAARGLTTPTMLIGVEHDATTPIEHAQMIFDALGGSRRLVVQRHTTHYASYRDNGDRILPMIVAWFDVHLQPPGDIVIRDAGQDGEVSS